MNRMLFFLLLLVAAFALATGCGDGDDTTECVEDCYQGNYDTMDFFNSGSTTGGPLTAIEKHRCIDGDLSLVDALDDSTEIPCLEDVGGDLTIAHNTSLSSLEILSGLSSVGGELVVQENGSLPYCEICGFLQHLSASPSSATYEGNLEDSCWDGTELTCP